MSSLRLALKASLEQPNASNEPGKQQREKERRQKKERQAAEGTTPVSHAKSAVKATRGPSSPVSTSKQLARRPPKPPSAGQARSPQKEARSAHHHGPERVKRDTSVDAALRGNFSGAAEAVRCCVIRCASPRFVMFVWFCSQRPTTRCRERSADVPTANYLRKWVAQWGRLAQLQRQAKPPKNSQCKWSISRSRHPRPRNQHPCH